MVFVPAPNVLKVDLRQTLFNQRISNTLYFQADSPPIAQVDMESLANEIEAWWSSSIAPGIVSALTLDEIYLTDLTTRTSPTYTHIPDTVVSGERTGAGLPGSVAFCISFRTAGRGRSSRGRNYIAGLTEDSVTGNVLDAAMAGAFVSAYAGLVARSELGGFMTWVIVSTYENKQPRAEALIQPVVTALSTDLNVDSQRRRLTGRGR